MDHVCKCITEILKHKISQGEKVSVDYTTSPSIPDSEVFRLNGLEKFKSEGQEFDPNLHSAMFELDDETKSLGKVAVVTKVGYKLHDCVIRPAEVGVVKSEA